MTFNPDAAPQPQFTTIREAAEYITENFAGDITPVVEFLKNLKPTEDVPSPVTEFCLTVKNLCRDNDGTIPVIILAGLMERILASK